MVDWTIIIPAGTAIAGIVTGFVIGNAGRSLWMDRAIDLEEANKIYEGSLGKQAARHQADMVALSNQTRDLHIRMLGQTVTLLGLKPSDLIEYSKSVDCKTAKRWTPAPRPRDGETMTNYMERVHQWLEETKTTPQSK